VAFEMKKLYQLISLDSAIDRFHHLGKNLSKLASSTAIVPAELMAIAMHDTGTFKHLINVSTYAVLLAKQLGIVEERELKEIATGGLLHDVGKRFMPQRLLNKTTAYNDKDRQLINQHPTRGFEELYPFEAISFGQKMMVYQHHERMNGEGYPVGITGEEIHPWARICAIVDVHEALTGNRYYRKSDPIPKVLEYLGEKAGTYFDKEIFQCWKLIMR
jgi:putative nucleotidyltransferase with HDIG domain